MDSQKGTVYIIQYIWIFFEVFILSITESTVYQALLISGDSQPPARSPAQKLLF